MGARASFVTRTSTAVTPLAFYGDFPLVDASTLRMHELPMTESATRSTRDVWTSENARGLAAAAEASWPEAADAFARAADAVTSAYPPEAAAHDVLSLVLSNLAQACFRAGRIDDGIRHAQRTCVLRAAIVGEDAIATARARADLAVMLGAAGRLDEATALMHRTIVSLEQSAGDEDLRLAVPLENAARLAMAAAQPANAEPHLLRLHALLSAHGFPTTRADVLLSRVAAARRSSTVPVAVAMPTPIVTSVIATPRSLTPRTLTPMVFDVTETEWEDQPLRDAVVVTDALLRTTPGGVPIVLPMIDVDVFAGTSTPSDVEAHVATPRLSPVEDDIFGGADIDLVDTTATYDSLLAAPLDGSDMGLGFAVEYGVNAEQGDDVREDYADLGPSMVASLGAFGNTIDLVSNNDEVAALSDVAPPVEMAAPIVTPSVDAVPNRTTPRTVAVVMPPPHAGVPTLTVQTSRDEAVADASVARGSTPMSDQLPRSRVPMRGLARANGGGGVKSSRELFIGGAVVAAGVAAAAWYFLRGGA